MADTSDQLNEDGVEDEPLDQEEIDALLRSGGPARSDSPTDEDIAQIQTEIEENTYPEPPGADIDESTGTTSREDIEQLLDQAERALVLIESAEQAQPPGAKPFELRDFSGTSPSTEAATLDPGRDEELDVKIELGRTRMHLEEVLKLRDGSVVPLDRLAGDTVDVYVKDRLVARGEILVLDDNFCIRIAEVIAGEPAAA